MKKRKAYGKTKFTPGKTGKITASHNTKGSLASGEPLRDIKDDSGAGAKYQPFGGGPKKLGK